MKSWTLCEDTSRLVRSVNAYHSGSRNFGSHDLVDFGEFKFTKRDGNRPARTGNVDRKERKVEGRGSAQRKFPVRLVHPSLGSRLSWAVSYWEVSTSSSQ